MCCSLYTFYPVRWIVFFAKSIVNMGRIIYNICFLVKKSIFTKILILAIIIDIQ